MVSRASSFFGGFSRACAAGDGDIADVDVVRIAVRGGRAAADEEIGALTGGDVDAHPVGATTGAVAACCPGQGEIAGLCPIPRCNFTTSGGRCTAPVGGGVEDVVSGACPSRVRRVGGWERHASDGRSDANSEELDEVGVSGFHGFFEVAVLDGRSRDGWIWEFG